MKLSLRFLALSFLLVTCHKEAPPPDAALVGYWLSAATLDSTGNWQPLYHTAESRSLLTEYRSDGSIVYHGSNRLLCCQPTRYTVARKEPCPPNSVCPDVTATINFVESVACPNALCVTPPIWAGYIISEPYLTLYSIRAGQPVTGVRYQRVNPA